MRRFLVPLFGIVLLLAGCTKAAESPKWGSFDVTLGNQKMLANQWVAELQIKNPTKETQVLQYTGPMKYSLHVYQGAKQIYKEGFGPLKEPLLLNILPGATQSHVVGWRFTDQEGKKVPPGTYQLKVELHAQTSAVKGTKMVGPVDVTVK